MSPDVLWEGNDWGREIMEKMSMIEKCIKDRRAKDRKSIRKMRKMKGKGNERYGEMRVRKR